MHYTLRKVGKHLNVKWGERLGRPECPYLRRWALILGLFSIRVHHFYRSDDERAFHDHPWWFVTLVLKGGYTDVSECDTCEGYGVYDSWCPTCSGWGEKRDHLLHGSVRFRPALHRHTVRVDPGGVWTLILTGPNVRTWGFWERRADGTVKFRKANKWFALHGHHPCDQP
jgi:hypothetical protein